MKNVTYFISYPRRLFLADGLGALLTVVLTLGVLARWTHWFGMPAEALYKLAIAGSVLVLYSFGCGLFIRRGFSPCLRVIAFANVGYAFATLVLCVVYRGEVTPLGWAYFIGECLVLMAVAGAEWKVAAALDQGLGKGSDRCGTS